MILLTTIISFVSIGFAIYYYNDIKDSERYFKHHDSYKRNRKRLQFCIKTGLISLLISILIPIYYNIKNDETLKTYQASMNYKTHIFTPQELDKHLEDKLIFYDSFGQSYSVFPFRDFVNNDRKQGTPIYVEGIVKSVKKDPNSFDYFLTFQNSSTIYRLNVTEVARYKLNKEPYKILLKVQEFADGGVYAHPINTDLFNIAKDSKDIDITKENSEE